MQGLTRIDRRLGWIAALAVVLAVSCRQPQPPDYYGFRNLQFARGAGGQTTLATTVKMYNSNPFNLYLKRAEVEVLINGKHAGHSLLDTTIFIPKKDTFFVPVALELDTKALFSNALSLLQSSRVNLTLEGRVKVQKGMMTFNRPFHYESKEDLNDLLSGAGF
ncbi:MAG TPA: LEA type 2 family protein [Puia sp.]|jgi:LEA14-like dessication related protein|uniref:LEA type 2 family protein n=1 Tax=Puia sp. TaxID=2045100 RepID=UPI002CA64BF6|nr:LEA type 2 family protein [Puia sp.]HVU96495.1 LEA type 2 family protein [Puia sp.]